ncbi:4-hydroxybenzoate octaprenyltransferase [Neomegalonema sp.]|uniref:4-hydroxybenzoate octaprenyltransferase n=1 Tax=Neomegalonema sp. TaxID=2039713 RepID=UPI002634E74C|nr:4-hydroxybenzoate octaprenyltransferase [Neomegalonema sp.]MDD2868227.1 4-hydroxybenzoate octaprenyltransferase [Neomegalonema sp.]
MTAGARAESRVADAAPANWVDLHAPGAWRPYLRLMRADRPIGTWLLLLPCWQSLGLAAMADAPRLGDLWIFLACGLGAVVMRGAGCVLNDIADRDFDGRVERTKLRPIPSGAVTLRQAALFMGALGLIGLMILLTLNKAAIWLGVLSLIPVAVYPFMKRITWWPQVFLGIAFNWGALLAWAAHAGSLSLAPVLLYLGGIFWTLGYDTIYAHQDKEDDALIGVKSTARLFGAQTRSWMIGFYVAAVLLAGAAGWAAGAGWPFWIGLCAYGAHLVWQIRSLRIDDAAQCLKLFRSNRDAGLLLMAGAWGAAFLA